MKKSLDFSSVSAQTNLQLTVLYVLKNFAFCLPCKTGKYITQEG